MNQTTLESSVPPLATAEHFLACIDVMVDWSALEPLLAAASDGAGTPLTLTALKIALIKQWYGIAEGEAAFSVLDRLSFRAFVGYNGDGSAADGALVQELHQGTWSRHPAMEGLINAVEEQLRELGYVVRGGHMREPSIAPCTESGDEAPAPDSTSLYRPGELGRMVEAVTAKAHSEGKAPTGPQEPAAPAQEEPAALGGAPSEQDAEPVRAILEWPWGQKSELTTHLNIGRDFTFSPLARELTPYTHVSRKHAELLVYGDGVWVRDLGSRNGTYVNNEEVPKGQAYLIDADSVIRFGPLLAVSLKLLTE